MRYFMLALIALSLPLFWGLLSQNPKRRPIAFALIVAMLFLGGEIRIQAFIYGWPGWEGTSKGFAVSFGDTLALALLATRTSRARMLPFIGCLCLYAIILLISIIPSQLPIAALFVHWQYARMILLFVVIGLEAGRPDVRNAILTGLCFGLIIQCGFVIQQKLAGVVQAPGTMGHQNILGMVTEAALMPLFAALLAGDRRHLIKLGVICALAIVALGGSRGTLSLTGGGLLALLLLSLARRATPTKAKVLGLAVLAMMAIVPLAYQTLNKRFGSSTVFTEEGTRTALENVARMMASDYILGVGPNQFVLVSNTKGYADRANVGGFEANRARPTHNAYLLARAETGWAGEIALIIIIFVPVIQGLRFAYSNRSDISGELALGSSVAIGVIGLHSNYEFALHTYHVFALFIVNMGVISAQISSGRLLVRNKISIKIVKNNDESLELLKTSKF